MHIFRISFYIFFIKYVSSSPVEPGSSSPAREAQPASQAGNSGNQPARPSPVRTPPAKKENVPQKQQPTSVQKAPHAANKLSDRKAPIAKTSIPATETADDEEVEIPRNQLSEEAKKKNRDAIKRETEALSKEKEPFRGYYFIERHLFSDLSTELSKYESVKTIVKDKRNLHLAVEKIENILKIIHKSLDDISGLRISGLDVERLVYFFDKRTVRSMKGAMDKLLIFYQNTEQMMSDMGGRFGFANVLTSCIAYISMDEDGDHNNILNVVNGAHSQAQTQQTKMNAVISKVQKHLGSICEVSQSLNNYLDTIFVSSEPIAILFTNPKFHHEALTKINNQADHLLDLIYDDSFNDYLNSHSKDGFFPTLEVLSNSVWGLRKEIVRLTLGEWDLESLKTGRPKLSVKASNFDRSTSQGYTPKCLSPLGTRNVVRMISDKTLYTKSEDVGS